VAFAFAPPVRLEKESFGPFLRRARERRGISLTDLAVETKLAPELWAELEENNLSRWPRQIYARSYVRDYALRVGLNPEEVVNDFCRLFPEWGDRRAERLLRGQAAIINHKLDLEDQPSPQRRRATDREPPRTSALLAHHRARAIAALLDVKIILAMTLVGTALRFPFWPSLAAVSVGYNVANTLLLDRSLGRIASEWLLRVISAMPAARRRLLTFRAS